MKSNCPNCGVSWGVVRAYPVTCSCGLVYGTDLATPIAYSPVITPTVVKKKPIHRSAICKKNECGQCNGVQCLALIEKKRKAGQPGGGWISYIDSFPNTRCAVDHNPQWFVGDVGVLAISYRPSGGTETFHQTLLNGLCDQLSIGGFVGTDERLSDGDFSKFICQTGVGMTSARRLVESSKTLIVWGVSDRLQTLLSGLDKKPKIVSVSHSDDRSLWNKIQLREQERFTDKFACVNRKAVDAVPIHRRDDAVVIYNGVDPSRIQTKLSRQRARKALGIPINAKLNVMLSRISEEKGIHRAVEAVRKTDQYLLVFGDVSPWSANYLERLKKRETDRIKILPRVDQVGDILVAADTYLSTSEYEGFGLSMAEAMLMGIQVISTPVGIVEDFPESAHVLPLHPKVSSIVKALNKTKDTRQYAQDLVSSRFSREAFLQNWKELLLSL